MTEEKEDKTAVEASASEAQPSQDEGSAEVAPEAAAADEQSPTEDASVDPQPVDDQAAAEEGVEAADADESAEGEPEGQMEWFVLKVQSNREKSVRASLERTIKREGLEDCFGEIVIPTEKIVETKSGKKKVVERKLYPGYLMIQMILTEDTWYLVRTTSGVGDFTGSAGKPIAMQEHEIKRMLGQEETKEEQPTKVKIDFAPGDIVKIKDGTFESFEGSIEAIDEANGKVTVLIEIFGRSTPTELEYWQVERV